MAAPPPGRLSGPVRRLALSLLALGRIRLGPPAVQAQEEKQRIASLLLWSVPLWDSDRLAALGGAAALFIGLVPLGLYRVRRLSANGCTLFQSSIAELRHDCAALREGPPP